MRYKTIRPFVLSGMKKRLHLRSFRVQSGEVRALLEVAVPASKREVIELRSPAMFPGNNVFDVERTAECHLGIQTILAAIAGAAPHLSGELGHAAYWRVCRALDCQ